jgi:hypothetical protein
MPRRICPESTAMAKDNRKAARSKTGAKAWIRPDEGFSVRPCVVADISSTGVQLIFDTPIAVGRNFILMMSRDARQGRRCRTKWRRGGRVGAEFLS